MFPQSVEGVAKGVGDEEIGSPHAEGIELYFHISQGEAPARVLKTGVEGAFHSGLRA